MKIYFETLGNVQVVGVSGSVDSHAAGELSDALVQCIAGGAKKLIVNLSGVHIMTRACVRALIVAAKLMDTAQSEMRICAALRSVEDFLRSRGFTYLLTCDATLQGSFAELRGVHGRQAALPAVPLRQAV